MIDTCANHSFISLEFLNKLQLKVSFMVGSMVIDTPTNGLVTTSPVHLNISMTIYRKDFRVDLICFPLSQVDVILGMNWLEFNHVSINCFNNTILFPEPEESVDSRFLYGGKV